MTDVERPGAQEWVPEHPDLTALRAAAPACHGCELHREGTQVVFSAGSADARIMLVGEQPGDQEDRAGEPFVGPAGRLLASAVERAGIDRSTVYVTNAVKHFHHEQRGKRRIHQKPSVAHVVACHPWLEAELAVVRPEVVVALGATAARSVLGRSVTIGRERGRLQELDDGSRLLVTTHPSALLRMPDEDARHAAFDELVADLRTAAGALR
ncbi:MULTISPECIES: UdgX family uracil-DNA binding protein [unclassified Curtobacterium]|uniref:UdgX family uracil-DNA binding protein n=1 Tax=unclassified Curtobacterium TaxID=257496 RepID=UPI000DAA40FB|nr:MULTISPECIES: UdgX family uracil-DNA binding protein [unclassified Curtobacterium]PZE24179.1 uracil-DNA glycosylase [Curtobacterium sp. MCBD17_028]PZF55492.1 uracil-DNA glycosylase [Curtobacterium sp. MCBD17_034]PZF58123.1 uracil-DNA glycosylase [Curtobacterium sp. MCBD17_013]PZM34739.1 uracil-DNA glycosylase [Curtobacterium sp. MCBD17_031]